MELLCELESQADEFIVERLRRNIADAPSGYKRRAPRNPAVLAAQSPFRILTIRV